MDKVQSDRREIPALAYNIMDITVLAHIIMEITAQAQNIM
jgi:hypothetical protein